MGNGNISNDAPEPAWGRHRRSIRLKGYDYTCAGAYFITICAENRTCLFGDIDSETMRLNDVGRMIQEIWDAIPLHYPGVDVDAFVVMPNHIHGIIILDGGQPQGVARPFSVGDMVQRFKSLTTKRYSDRVHAGEWPPFPGRLWQRNYYELIIRDERALNAIREYIYRNPARWAEDAENDLRQRDGQTDATVDRDPVPYPTTFRTP